MATKQPKIKGRWSNDYKTKEIEDPETQNAKRRDAKKGRKTTGLAELANNPHVGATKAARHAHYRGKQDRCVEVTFAMASPIIKEMKNRSVLRVTYDFLLAYRDNVPIGRNAFSFASESVKTTLGDHFDERTLTLGIRCATKILKDAQELIRATQDLTEDNTAFADTELATAG